MSDAVNSAAEGTSQMLPSNISKVPGINIGRSCARTAATPVRAAAAIACWRTQAEDFIDCGCNCNNPSTSKTERVYAGLTFWKNPVCEPGAVFSQSSAGFRALGTCRLLGSGRIVGKFRASTLPTAQLRVKTPVTGFTLSDARSQS